MNALPASERRRTLYVILAATAAALTTFLFGYKGGVMSLAITYMTDQFHLSPQMQGFVMSCASFGYVLGPAAGGFLCDRIGREKTLLVAVVITGVASLMNAIAMNITIGGAHISSLSVFNIFHIIDGFAAGLGAIATPMYIAEIAPPRMRGKLAMIFQLAIVLGAGVAPLLCYPISLYFPADTSWRWMFASALPLVLALIVFIALLPPSPRWLAEKGRFDEARIVLEKIHGPELAHTELVQIRKLVTEEKDEGEWRELWQKGIRFALFVGLCLAFFNSWTGSTVGGYSTLLIEQSGVKSHSLAILQMAYLNNAMVIMTIVSMFLIDRAGRRPLWIVASVLMTFVTLFVGLVYQCHLTGWIVVVALGLISVPHGIALGGIPWLMMSELFPNRVRAKAVAVTTTFLIFAQYLSGQCFPIFEAASTRHLGSPAGAFWVFTVVCVLSTIFGLTIMPETRGRSLEAIAGSFSRRKTDQTRT